MTKLDILDIPKWTNLPSSAHTDFMPSTVTAKKSEFDLRTTDVSSTYMMTINASPSINDIHSEIADKVKREIDRYTLERSKEEKMPIKECRRIGNGLYKNVEASAKYHSPNVYYEIEIPVNGDRLYLNLHEWDGNITETLRLVTRTYGWLERHVYLTIKTYVTQAHRRKIEREAKRDEHLKAKSIKARYSPLYIKDVKFNGPATIVFWDDDTKTVVKAQGDEEIDHEKGLAMAVAKKVFGNESNYNNEFKRWLKESKDEA